MSETAAAAQTLTDNAKLISWVEEIAELTQPDEVYGCDGSAEEYTGSPRGSLDAGTSPGKLDEAKRPELIPRVLSRRL